MKEALLFGGAIAAFVGIVLNETGDGADAGHAPDATADAAPTAIPVLQPPASYAQQVTPSFRGTTELLRSGDGHFYARVEVNGRPTLFMIDTGATGIALTGADAQALGLHWTYNELGIVAQGASGPVTGVRRQLDRVALDGHEVRGLEAIVVPEGLGISLLGQNFLSTIASVRMEGDRMILSENPVG